MTEAEVLEKFDKYGNAIKILKSRLEEKERALKDLEQKYDLKQSNWVTVKTNAQQANEILSSRIEKINEEYSSLKSKTFKTIKHLVEDVIEPMEKEINTPKRGNVQALEELAKFKEENQVLSRENLALKEQIEEQDEKIIHLRNEVGVKTTEIEKLKLEVSQLKSGPRIINKNQDGVFHYKFATLKKETMSKVLNFVDALFDKVEGKEGKVALQDIFQSAQKANLSEKELDIFTKRFNEMKVNSLPIISFENGKAYSYFKPDWIKQYISIINY